MLPGCVLQRDRLLVEHPVGDIFDAGLGEKVERLVGLGQPRALPAARRLAGEFLDRGDRVGDRRPLVFDLVHRPLHEAVAHEIPAGVAGGLAGFADRPRRREPLSAKVAFRFRLPSASTKRQKPTRMPYSCQAQFGTSGSSGCPIGGGSTARGIAPVGLQFSTLTMVHTATRALSGSLSGRPAVDRRVGQTAADALSDRFGHRLFLPLLSPRTAT